MLANFAAAIEVHTRAHTERALAKRPMRQTAVPRVHPFAQKATQEPSVAVATKFHAYEDTTSAKRGLAATLSAQPST